MSTTLLEELEKGNDGLIHADMRDDRDTKGMPSDPDVFTPGQSQWHLVGTWGVRADKVWNDYTGSNILIGVLDDGFQHSHTEISPNYRTDLDLDTLDNDSDASPNQATDNHGTSVIGTIIGDDNGTGMVGVAFDAQAFGIRKGFGAQSSMDDTVDGFAHARAQDVDVMNNSWGYTTPFADDFNKEFVGTDFYAIENIMIDMAANGRGGLGSNIVFSAGNNRTDGDNTNYHNLKNSPYMITVGAHTSTGDIASFSTPGASILTSAGGQAVWTTDRTGASGYAGGDFTNFSGTSASAPVVSGVVALILEANDDLGWRDVQEIIAYSSRQADPTDLGWQYNGTGNWNGGGLHYSHDFGYGAIDAYNAVRLAESWTRQSTSANMTTISTATATPNLAIQDSNTVQTTINVAQDIEIEWVLVDIDLVHGLTGDLVIKLISPDGTESTLVNRPSNGAFTSIYGISGIDFELTSAAHRGESSLGTWTLQIQDAAGGNVGTLNSWDLTFMGRNHSNDDLYVFSDEYESFSGGALAARSTITDTNGGTDTLNLAMVTYDVQMVMTDGAGQTVLNNNSFTIAAGTIIENAYLGDGDDQVQSNDANNYVHGGRGDDSITVSKGTDTFDGGIGNDTARFLEFVANYTFDFSTPGTVVSTHSNPMNVGTNYGVDTWRNFELFNFSDGTYNLAQLQALANSSNNNNLNITFTHGGANYNTTSTNNGTNTLSGGTLSLPGLSGNLVQLIRTGEDLNVNFLTTSGPASMVLDGSNQRDVISITGAFTWLNPRINAGDGDDEVTLGMATRASQIYGGNGSDVITGNSGTDILYGESGDDSLSGGAGNDTLFGGIGTDTLTGGLGADTINGEDGDDEMYGNAGNDIMSGGNGTDLLFGGIGNDNMNGGNGGDTLNGGDGDDTVNGGDDNDIVSGDAGADTLYGGIGNDTVNGGLSRDTLYGDNGNDTLNGDEDIDKVYGGDGTDTLNGGDGNDNLFGGTGNDTLNGDADNDLLLGDAGDDTLNGGAGIDTLRGGAENDRLNGGDGNDNMYGEDGDDVLVGGAGVDNLYGGAGADVFGFTSAVNGAEDRIYDFAMGQDRLNITDILSGFTPGADIDLFIRFSHKATQTIASVNADGVGTDFHAFAIFTNTAVSGQTVQDMYDNGFIIANQSLL